MASPPRHGAPGLPGSPSHNHNHNHNNNNNNNSGVRKCGYLRKQKHGHKRFFVLRGPGAAVGDEQQQPPQPQQQQPQQPPRLEYYESEKKWRSKAGAPKRVIALDCCLNINKRADAKHKYLIALYTRDEYFAVAADSEQEQDGWYRALTELVSEGRAAQAAAAAAAANDAPRAALAASCSASLPGALGSSSAAASAGAEDAYGPGGAPGAAAAYREVWQVNLKPKGLGQTKNLTGVYRLCLSARTVGFVKLNCEQPSVTLQLMNIRRCGHSDSFFFIEVGRSAVTGPGELWMQADDSVVAQHIHETILEAMKALKELFEFRPRSKSQSSATHPISVPGARRHHHHHLVQLPPSQTGLVRRSRTDSLAATPPAAKCASCRARTASEGESGAAAGTPAGTPAGRPVSVAGSPLSPGPARAPLSRSHTLGGGGRAAAKGALLPAGGALQHSRSMSMPVAHSPPAATSPGAGSLPSGGGGGGGHGSASAHPAAPRPSSGSASASGSPSDPGFMSLDESGSSPGDPRSFCGHRSNTPDGMAETPPARDGPGGAGGELYGGYMAMDRPPSHCGRPYRRVSGDAPDLERGLRHRTYSLTTPARQRPAPQPASGSLDEYTLMRATFAGSHGRPCPSCPVASSPKVAYHPYPDDHGDVEIASQRSSSGHLGPDDGYVPMTPGAVLRGPATARSGRRGDEYMPMSPTSVSAPQQILKPRGATVGPLGPASNASTPSSLAAVLRGFPGKAGSPVGSSPEDSGYMRMWSGPKVPAEAPDARLLSSDYLNMSPSDAGPAGTPPDFFSVSGYGHMHGHGHADGCPSSLPRAYKDHDHYVLMSSPVGRILEEERPEPVPAPSPVAARPEGLAVPRSRAVRPTRLSLDSLQTLPCMHESPLPPEPQSPGEYINIDFGEAGARLLGSATSSSSLLSAGSPASSLGSGTPGTSSDSRQRSPLSDYMNLDFSSPRPGPAGTALPLGSLDGPLSTHPAAPSVAARAAVPPVPRPPSHGELYHQPGAAPTAAQGRGAATLGSASATDSDYTEMAFGVAATSPQPIAAPPKPEGPRLGSPTSGVKRLSLMEQVSGLEAFLQVSQPADPHRGAKVIRADPQGGRRRHSSETFSSTTTVTPVSPSFAHTPKRHNSASVENVSLRKSSEGALGGSSGALGVAHDAPASPRHQQPSLAPAARPWTASPVGGLVGGPMRRETSAGFQNGLNYIAIDVRDQLPPDKGAWGRTRSLGGLIGAVGGGGGSVCGGPGPAPNTYASIDFLSHHLKEAAVVKE
ncbi:insulin receptor substrate 2 [Suncus etruscus]|uniref:insulin receptor substrate 2 n=1 Tax=Suncus etruscus TaxID=109475 RepID=UPI00210FE3A4|nr:insulin receptor substrate 2 [Suncus etruscus]